MDSMGDWVESAACFDHPFLPPDAWGGLSGGRPANEGAEAWMVCTFVCPVRRECAEKFKGADIIAGGGWFLRDEVFVLPHPDFLDMNRAAAYLGVDLDCMRRWGRTRLTSYVIHGRVHFLLTDIKALSRNPTAGPRHGTERAWRLHKLRGEQVCNLCELIETAPPPKTLQPVA